MALGVARLKGTGWGWRSATRQVAASVSSSGHPSVPLSHCPAHRLQDTTIPSHWFQGRLGAGSSPSSWCKQTVGVPEDREPGTASLTSEKTFFGLSHFVTEAWPQCLPLDGSR